MDDGGVAGRQTASVDTARARPDHVTRGDGTPAEPSGGSHDAGLEPPRADLRESGPLPTRALKQRWACEVLAGRGSHCLAMDSGEISFFFPCLCFVVFSFSRVDSYFWFAFFCDSRDARACGTCLKFFEHSLGTSHDTAE